MSMGNRRRLAVDLWPAGRDICRLTGYAVVGAVASVCGHGVRSLRIGGTDGGLGKQAGRWGVEYVHVRLPDF